jgi:hypothetical protein
MKIGPLSCASNIQLAIVRITFFIQYKEVALVLADGEHKDGVANEIPIWL